MHFSMLENIRAEIRANTLSDEAEALHRLVGLAGLSAEQRAAISSRAIDLVRTVRERSDVQMLEVFLSEYGLSTREGVALMCLAEALLRVPDTQTMDDLIHDKIAPHDWSSHSGGSSSVFVNASTWALMLTGSVLDDSDDGIEGTLRAMIRRLGEPVIRTAVAAAMREMGEHFVLGRTIDEAMRRGRDFTRKGYLYSFDMLGEAARTEHDALRYHRAYADAIASLGAAATAADSDSNHGISVKLSALHPRYEMNQKDTMLPVVVQRLLSLALAARDARIGLNIDAEESDRLDLSMDVTEQVLSDPRLAGWKGMGVVVQAYGPRAAFVIDWLYALAERIDRRIMVRLVKGAYWDTEIKRAQVLGLAGYPVFTRKPNTDVSYIACARKLLGMTDRLYPQFATHNAHSVAAVLAMAGNKASFEFQRLHGMGEALHEAVRETEGTRCRIYAPVGAHSDLLAYLVRRLLENGANSSFVHQIVNKTIEAEDIVHDPFETVMTQGPAANPAIPSPARIFGTERRNSRGFDVTDPMTLARIDAERKPFAAPHLWKAGPMAADAVPEGKTRSVRNPAKPGERVGEVVEASAADVTRAVDAAVKAQTGWERTPVTIRADKLIKAADLYEQNAMEFFALCAREAGKTLADGVAEVREAVDFLRYYAGQAAGAEHDTAARGVIACISPWNFPLAIFTGQIAAALVTGNTVVAKPAEQTPLIGARAVALLHQAGIPAGVLQLLIGDGPAVGAPLTADPRIAGVCFTGSLEVARSIEQQIAATAEPDAMLIAETGGLNAMIVDSTALPEQAVRDVIASAFQSAGQRCSALRILYVQKDVEQKTLEMLKGALAMLKVGDPSLISTDVGPVIDEEARKALLAYCAEMENKGRLIAKLDPPSEGCFVGPHIFRVSGIAEMEREMFGPILHVASFEADEIDKVIADINAKQYGLTFGLHTRIDARVKHLVDRIHAGNIYVNRNQIGAVVGSQPFGGEGLSGTGPKAGGPHYLRRYRKGPATAVQGAEGPVVPASMLAERMPDATRDGWSTRPDRLAVLRKHLRGKGAEAVSASAVIDFGPVDLPGPTGEANTLLLAPRGRVLCLGVDEHAVLAQAIQALAAGNAVLAVAPRARAALSPLIDKGLPIRAIDGTVDPGDLVQLNVDVVAISADIDTLRALRRALAKRSGPIVPLVSEAIKPNAYMHERAVCIDTTAAGGNATLLAAAEPINS
jgi:RHH-type proline utilization regulon transcriptional repressor/proline dehydrogenase/delta 1-pyrroline-5-carboxylate dehydrogenase